MTLENTLLQRLSDWQPIGEGRHTLSVLDDQVGWTVTLTADRQDQIGCVVWEMNLRRTKAVTAADPLAALRAWADRTARNVKGLLELLSVIEVDATRQEALLRSHEPSRRSEALAYYEVHLQGTHEVTVRRYKAADRERREQVPFVLTHEVLAHFVADLTAEV